MARYYGDFSGFRQIRAELNEEVAKIKDRTLAGLIRATIKIRRDMDLVYPKVPVDTGNLRSSYFTVTSNGGIVSGSAPAFSTRAVSGRNVKDVPRLVAEHSFVVEQKKAQSVQEGRSVGPNVIFGFTAYYGVPVHEMMGVNYRRQGAGAKFFESALRNNKDYVLKIIAETARIKK